MMITRTAESSPRRAMGDSLCQTPGTTACQTTPSTSRRPLTKRSLDLVDELGEARTNGSQGAHFASTELEEYSLADARDFQALPRRWRWIALEILAEYDHTLLQSPVLRYCHALSAGAFTITTVAGR